MSCHGETNFNANPSDLTWEEFRDAVVTLAELRNDDGFRKYVAGVTARAWQHVLSENFFSPEAAEKRLWGFYQSDVASRH